MWGPPKNRPLLPNSKLQISGEHRLFENKGNPSDCLETWVVYVCEEMLRIVTTPRGVVEEARLTRFEDGKWGGKLLPVVHPCEL